MIDVLTAICPLYQLLMSNKVIFLSYLIITICTFEFSAQMYRFRSNKVTFITCLILTLWALEFLAHMNGFLMSVQIADV